MDAEFEKFRQIRQLPRSNANHNRGRRLRRFESYFPHHPLTQKPPLAGRSENLPRFSDMRKFQPNGRSLNGYRLPRSNGISGPVSRPQNGFSERCPPTAAETGSHMAETWFARFVLAAIKVSRGKQYSLQNSETECAGKRFLRTQALVCRRHGVMLVRNTPVGIDVP